MESDIGIGPIPAFAGLTLAAGLYFTCLAVTHTIRAALFQRFGEAANLVVDPTTIRQAAGIYLLSPLANAMKVKRRSDSSRERAKKSV